MNWKIRFQNKTFWIAVISLIILVIKYFGEIFQYTLDVGALENIFNGILLCAVSLGVIIDPTTPQILDLKTKKKGEKY